MSHDVAPADVEAVRAQLGRLPRGIVDIAHRCPCGEPDVVRTLPRLPDGTPFPTTFYATCPRLTGAISTLESSGMMREMSERLKGAGDMPASALDLNGLANGLGSRLRLAGRSAQPGRISRTP